MSGSLDYHRDIRGRDIIYFCGVPHGELLYVASRPISCVFSSSRRISSGSSCRDFILKQRNYVLFAYGG